MSFWAQQITSMDQLSAEPPPQSLGKLPSSPPWIASPGSLPLVHLPWFAWRPPGSAAGKQSVLELTTRKTEVARLAGKGLLNPELYIIGKAIS
jgi:hypothetical protein